MMLNRPATVVLSTIALSGALVCALARAADAPVIGLITKTETNTFFVKMKEAPVAEAKNLGAKLLAAAAKADGDNAGQVTALENLVAAGAKTILIAPNNA